MSTSVAVPDWIKRIADEERKRDAARLREEEIAARQSDLVRLNGRRLLDELRATITRDLEAFRSEFPADATRDVLLEAADSGGFVVRKLASPAVVLTVTPNLPVSVPSSSIITWKGDLQAHVVDDRQLYEVVLRQGGSGALVRLEGTGRILVEQAGT